MAELKLEHIFQDDRDGRKVISRWEMIFAGIEKPGNHDYPNSSSCRFSEINGRIHMHDIYDRPIMDFSTSVEEIQLLLKYINKIFYKYEFFKPRDINWYKIGREAFSLLENDREKQLENQKKHQDEIAARNSLAQSLSAPKIPNIVHHVLSGPEWIDKARCVYKKTPLYDKIWFAKEICLLFADSNIGKSILATQIACDIALQNRKVVYFDYEMRAGAFIDRFGALFKCNPSLPEYFIRCQPNPDLFLCNNAVNLILADIVSIIQKHHAEVIVIDNITFINSNIKNSSHAAKLIYNLKKIAIENSISMLIIAHSAKRNPSKPITQSDLAGSKNLFNFADSVFAIGQSNLDPAIQYLKQLKSRSSEIVYGSKNVILMRRVFTDGYLHFERTGYDSEASLLRLPGKSTLLQYLKKTISQFESDGKSQREIAALLGISQSKVSRLKNS